MQNLLVRSFGYQFAAVLARSRPQVENPIGRTHNIRIMLDHQNRVSEIAQAVKNLNQPVRIPRVQPDRRLIQHIQRSYQPRSQRSRQLNTLCLPA